MMSLTLTLAPHLSSALQESTAPNISVVKLSNRVHLLTVARKGTTHTSNIAVYGIDISEGMLEVARERVLGSGLAERVELQCGDATALPFAPEFFDAVFMSFTLELFDTPEIPVVLRECRRALKVGGRLCIVAMSRQGKERLMVKLYEWAHRKIPGYVDCRPIYVGEAIEQAGFQVVEVINNSIWGLPVEIVKAEKPNGKE